MRKFSFFGLLLVFALGISAGAVGCSKLQNVPVSDPAQLTQGVGGSGLSQQASTGSSSSVLPAAGDINDITTTEDQVVKDFQSDISYFYKAWKAQDMQEFKRVSGLGLGGSLLERLSSEAQQWIDDGEGADVNSINYLNVKLVKLEENRASVECQYNYAGFEYNLATGARGEKFGPVNLNKTYLLEKKDNRWLIIDEKEN